MEDKIFDLMEKLYVEMQKGFRKVDERFNQVDERFNQVNERFNQVDERFNQVEADLKELREAQARIEHDHGEKLAALFDFQKSQEEINKHVLSALDRIEEKIDTHDIQIHVLDKTKADKRKVK